VIDSTEALFTDLRSQYLVGYSSSRPMDGKYRRIKVDARDKETCGSAIAGVPGHRGEVKAFCR
jgi:hypothetical protein